MGVVGTGGQQRQARKDTSKFLGREGYMRGTEVEEDAQRIKGLVQTPHLRWSHLGVTRHFLM